MLFGDAEIQRMRRKKKKTKPNNHTRMSWENCAISGFPYFLQSQRSQKERANAYHCCADCLDGAYNKSLTSAEWPNVIHVVSSTTNFIQLQGTLEVSQGATPWTDGEALQTDDIFLIQDM